MLWGLRSRLSNLQARLVCRKGKGKIKKYESTLELELSLRAILISCAIVFLTTVSDIPSPASTRSANLSKQQTKPHIPKPNPFIWIGIPCGRMHMVTKRGTEKGKRVAKNWMRRGNAGRRDRCSWINRPQRGHSSWMGGVGRRSGPLIDADDADDVPRQMNLCLVDVHCRGPHLHQNNQPNNPPP